MHGCSRKRGRGRDSPLRNQNTFSWSRAKTVKRLIYSIECSNTLTEQLKNVLKKVVGTQKLFPLLFISCTWVHKYLQLIVAKI